MKLLFTLAFAATLISASAFAQEFKAGDIVVDKAWARATPKGAAVGVGYLAIHNNGDAPERFVGGAAAFASVELHEMSMTGGVMKMRELKNGLEIPAHGTITLSPGGDHLMFVGLKQPLQKDQPIKATLTFARAGAIEVSFAVSGIGAQAPGDGMKMK